MIKFKKRKKFKIKIWIKIKGKMGSVTHDEMFEVNKRANERLI